MDQEDEKKMEILKDVNVEESWHHVSENEILWPYEMFQWFSDGKHGFWIRMRLYMTRTEVDAGIKDTLGMKSDCGKGTA